MMKKTNVSAGGNSRATLQTLSSVEHDEEASVEALSRRRREAALQSNVLRKTGKHSGQSAESLIRSHRKNHA